MNGLYDLKYSDIAGFSGEVGDIKYNPNNPDPNQVLNLEFARDKLPD